MRKTAEGLATPTDTTPPDTIPDHGVDIFRYVQEFEEETWAILTGDGDELSEHLDGFALEMLVWRGDTGAGYPGYNPGVIVEWLLTYGGPTVRLQYDNRYNYGELYHSWGFNPFTGKPQTTLQVSGDLVGDLAATFGVE